MTTMAFESSPSQPQAGVVFFERRELDALMRLYGRMVAAGEWRAVAQRWLPAYSEEHENG